MVMTYFIESMNPVSRSLRCCLRTTYICSWVLLAKALDIIFRICIHVPNVMKEAHLNCPWVLQMWLYYPSPSGLADTTAHNYNHLCGIQCYASLWHPTKPTTIFQKASLTKGTRKFEITLTPQEMTLSKLSRSKYYSFCKYYVFCL